jgi:hypothetical protein
MLGQVIFRTDNIDISGREELVSVRTWCDLARFIFE